MHVTVANERLSLDNYATAPNTCGGAASSAATTSMHSIKPNDYDISFEKKRSITKYRWKRITYILIRLLTILIRKIKNKG